MGLPLDDLVSILRQVTGRCRYVPTPSTFIVVIGAAGSLLLMLIAALAGPTACGLKVTTMEQFVVAVSVRIQPFDLSENAGFVLVILLMVIGC